MQADRAAEAIERPEGVRASVWNGYREQWVLQHLRCAGKASDIVSVNMFNDFAPLDVVIDGIFADIKVHPKVATSTPLNMASRFRKTPRKFENLVTNGGMFIAADPTRIAVMTPEDLALLPTRVPIEWTYDSRPNSRSETSRWDIVLNIPFTDFSYVIDVYSVALDDEAFRELQSARDSCQAIFDFEVGNFPEIAMATSALSAPCPLCGVSVERNHRHLGGTHLICAAHQEAGLPPVTYRRPDVTYRTVTVSEMMSAGPDFTWRVAERPCPQCGLGIHRGDRVGALATGEPVHYDCT